tara:strand:+ start:752 stop:898 length:147 start_codon:yes stop_codon:yes gene_type:complete
MNLSPSSVLAIPHTIDKNMRLNYLIITILLFVNVHVLAKDKILGMLLL